MQWLDDLDATQVAKQWNYKCLYIHKFWVRISLEAENYFETVLGLIVFPLEVNYSSRKWHCMDTADCANQGAERMKDE